MNLIVKMTVGIYVLSVLAFSSWSRSETTHHLFEQKQDSKISLVDSKGVVFEINGHLYFEDQKGQLSLIHSNDFDLFSNIKLPIEVLLIGQSLNINSFSHQPNIIQITKLSILKEKSLKKPESTLKSNAF